MAGQHILFYDGTCGFCHASVRFLLRRDAHETMLFSPLQGEHIRKVLPPHVIATLPDTIVLVTDGGHIAIKSTATAMALIRLGGIWGALGKAMLFVPQFLRDAAYDAIGRWRKKLRPQPPDLCPVLPPHLRSRFLT